MMQNNIPKTIMDVLNAFNPKMDVRGLQNIQTSDDMAQYLLNSGMVSQSQVNQAKQLWEKPNIRQMVLNRFRF